MVGVSCLSGNCHELQSQQVSPTAKSTHYSPNKFTVGVQDLIKRKDGDAGGSGKSLVLVSNHALLLSPFS